MSLNTFGHLFRVTTWGESHGPALGATVDGCPPNVAIDEADIQHWLDNVNRALRNTPPNGAKRTPSKSSPARSRGKRQAHLCR